MKRKEENSEASAKREVEGRKGVRREGKTRIRKKWRQERNKDQKE